MCSFREGETQKSSLADVTPQVHGIWDVPGDVRDGSPIFFGILQVLKIPFVPPNARILPLAPEEEERSHFKCLKILALS